MMPALNIEMLRVPETPVKKQRIQDMKSAETQGMTPQKYIQDLDAQYLFDNFDDIIKVTFTGQEGSDYQQSPERLLQFSELEFQSPVKIRFTDFSKSTSKKQKHSLTPLVQIQAKEPIFLENEQKHIEISEKSEKSESIENDKDYIFMTIAKPTLPHENNYILAPKKVKHGQSN